MLIRITGFSMLLAMAVVGLLQSTTNPARAEEQPLLTPQQCRDFSKRLEEQAAHAARSVRLTGKSNVWPGGKKLMVELNDVASAGAGYVAAFVGTECQKVPVVLRHKDETAKTTTLELDLPDIRFSWWQTKKLVLVSFPVKDGKPVEDSPYLSASETVWISNWRFSALLAFGAGGVAYCLAVFAVGKKKGRFSWKMVYLTSDRFDKASLSRFQLLGFTLLVVGTLVFVLARVCELSDISEHLLWLLGISAVGTVGTTVTEGMKQRLSFANWSWLRNQGWLTAHEEGSHDYEPDPDKSHWGDLLKAADGSLNIYSFQLAAFSAIVALALVRSVFLDDIGGLATFVIPKNILALLGLSNGVYIGGKTIPKEWEELDRKVGEVRQAEEDWIGKVAPDTRAQTALPDKLHAATQAAPKEYEVYITRARAAARMLKTLFPAPKDSRFAQTITDDELMPRFP